MRKRGTQILKYALMIAVTGFLLWLSFINIEVEEGQSKWGFLVEVWKSADKPFLFASAVAAILSHLIRAERWKLLLHPVGEKASTLHGFLSVMVGYFINLVIPRGGEVSRCYNLYRLNGAPVEVSLGTVVAERVIDLFFLITLIAVSFLIELDNLLYFFQSDQIKELSGRGGSTNSRFYWMLGIGAIVFIAALYFLARYFYRSRKFLALRVMSKTRKALRGLKSGLLSVFRLEKRGLFIFYSVLIWVLYYFMMYLVMLAFPETARLGFFAALTIFVIGGIAMALPLPGGAGSFHILVPLGLVMLYSLPQEQAVAFTFIFHGWQTLVIIIVGAISLILSQTVKDQLNRESNKKENPESAGTGAKDYALEE